MAEKQNLKPDDLVFPAPKGNAWTHSNFRDRVWNPARDAAGVAEVPYMTGSHSTKRSTVTLAFESGLSVATIRGQTKHSGNRIIQDTYLQTADGAEDAVAAEIQNSLGLPE